MLTAKKKGGEMLSLGEVKNKDQLLHIKKTETFYCPQCEEKVILKTGSKRIWHFAHERGSECTEQYDRESEYHMLGKLKLYKWLRSKGIPAELETYYPIIKQRPDITFLYEGKTYCIEYQCSTISEEIFIKRTKNYKRHQLIPIWILGGKNINRRQQYKLSLSNFHYLFVQTTYSSNSYLHSYCPNANQWVTLTHLQPITTRNTFAHLAITSLENVPLSELFNPSVKNHLSFISWREEMKRLKTTILTSKQAFQDPFLKELYQHQLNPLLLPPYIGIPLGKSYMIETPPLIWQAYFFIDNLLGKQMGSQITYHNVYLNFIKRIRLKKIKVRELPCIDKAILPCLVIDYLSKLEQLSVLEKINSNTYICKQTIVIPKTLDELQVEENLIYPLITTNSSRERF
ncbi:competence protein CoiA family protein [Bacillus sp. 31A1R]|uniref:Competence protein CoiA family protein n=1 Tax=Robertmurraya mangrovi TaxID=3098077 RepID=A0ABU5IT82_9BACI|nr:competence protein CoiA family protein [Bacillus sp. 31A1R]MDZ5470357.1 competence protein CoiA family protein [Bacillus sp. 31A1R]